MSRPCSRSSLQDSVRQPGPSMPILSEKAGESPSSSTVSAKACAMLRPLISASISWRSASTSVMGGLLR